MPTTSRILVVVGSFRIFQFGHAAFQSTNRFEHLRQSSDRPPSPEPLRDG